MVVGLAVRRGGGETAACERVGGWIWGVAAVVHSHNLYEMCFLSSGGNGYFTRLKEGR
jgi:hypothetical protein